MFPNGCLFYGADAGFGGGVIGGEVCVFGTGFGAGVTEVFGIVEVFGGVVGGGVVTAGS